MKLKKLAKTTRVESFQGPLSIMDPTKGFEPSKSSSDLVPDLQSVLKFDPNKMVFNIPTTISNQQLPTKSTDPTAKKESLTIKNIISNFSINQHNANEPIPSNFVFEIPKHINGDITCKLQKSEYTPCRDLDPILNEMNKFKFEAPRRMEDGKLMNVNPTPSRKKLILQSVPSTTPPLNQSNIPPAIQDLSSITNTINVSLYILLIYAYFVYPGTQKRCFYPGTHKQNVSTITDESTGSFLSNSNEMISASTHNQETIQSEDKLRGKPHLILKDEMSTIIPTLHSALSPKNAEIEEITTCDAMQSKQDLEEEDYDLEANSSSHRRELSTDLCSILTPEIISEIKGLFCPCLHSCVSQNLQQIRTLKCQKY